MEVKNDLGKDSIGKLLFKLSTPAIIAQLVNVLYNIVDRIFIGKIENGDLAMAGLGISLPIILLITAVSSLVGVGGAPIAAIKMGEDNNDEAEKIMSNSFSTLVILGIILTIVLSIAKEKLSILKNKMNELVEMAKEAGKPVIENAANAAKKELANVTREVLNKLESK